MDEDVMGVPVEEVVELLGDRKELELGHEQVEGVFVVVQHRGPANFWRIVDLNFVDSGHMAFQFTEMRDHNAG
jgi:hypothetical protein